MYRIAIVLALVMSSLPRVCVAAEPSHEKTEAEAVTIPLDQIWAYEMPGTCDIRELEPTPPKDSLVEPIQQSLGQKKIASEPTQGFLVKGSDVSALQQLREVLVSGKTANRSVATQENVWVVFFTHDSAQFVHIQNVERKGNEITIQYTFAPHDSREMSHHFALIPLGQLKAGGYRVTYVNSPMAKRFVNMGYRPIPEPIASQIVCKSFEFVVIQEPDK